MKKIVPVLVIAFLIAACQKEYIPKPRGYFRIEFPEKKYQSINEKLPYQFNIPVYSTLVNDDEPGSEMYWRNIMIPSNNAEIHISYKKVDSNLSTYTEESRSLAYQHSIKADAIDEQVFVNPIDKVFGTIYFIDGNAASPIQFYLTDSVNHFLRGALYINEIPNIDSIRPVINFLRPDIIHLIETTRWNN
ncbi:gliding motility lipoprotein GldD [Sunxiuqinia sp. A32]|uniref:gliding motility lipoprotein GldD n=1 Tax=Sunxiuqinia sp. A32 TaxID=3461496 RepID=UPI0040463A0F